ncbi:MAG: HEPN domain-containing protein [Acetobacteraceae bacterium]|nr:HEPN domain-containing protein [Acetobacteraceae bacterium]
MSEPDSHTHWRVVEEWLEFARDDLRVMRACCEPEPPVYRMAAYLCQQAAEKVLKGFHVKANVRVRKTHDLVALADVVIAHFPDIAHLATQTESWTDWNVAYRYPGESDRPPDPSRSELEAAATCIEQLAAVLWDLAPPGYGRP